MNKIPINRHVNRNYALELLKKFWEPDSVKNKEIQVENSLRNEDIEVTVLGYVAIDPAPVYITQQFMSGIKIR